MLFRSEAWLALVDAEKNTTVGHAQAATITEPALDASVSVAGGPLTMRWTSTLEWSPLPKPSLWARVRSLFIGDALAHLPPVTAALHEVELRIPGRTCPVRHLTSDTRWTLSASEWAVLQGASGQTVDLVVTSAYQRDNRVTEGPYRATTAHRLRLVP